MLCGFRKFKEEFASAVLRDLSTPTSLRVKDR